MIVLTSSDIIRVGLSAATAIDAVASYADNAAASFAPGNQILTFAVAGPTTVVSAPAALTTRNVSNLGFQARGGANTLDVEVFTGGSAFNLCTVALSAGDRLEYENGSGWTVTDSSGATKTVAGVPGPGTIPLTSLATQAANTIVGNWTGGVASPTANAVGANTVVGAVAGNTVAAALVNAQIATNTIDATKQAQMAANTVKVNATAGAANESDLAMAASTFLVRLAAGNIVAGTVAQVLALLAATTTFGLQAFTASGTYTPTTGMKACIVITTGSGGGAGGADAAAAAQCVAGGGGGAGGTCIEFFSAATIGASQAVTIGTAGTAGANTGGNGGNGGNSTFGALHTANGGTGGTGKLGAGTPGHMGYAAGGTGGVPTGGLLNITGGDGEDGYGVVSDGNTDFCMAKGGDGGSSFWGGGGKGANTYAVGLAAGAAVAGSAGKAFGSGGGGAVDNGNATGQTGGVGIAGCCLVIELI